MTSDETTRSTTVGLIERIDAKCYRKCDCDYCILLIDCRDELAKQAERERLATSITDTRLRIRNLEIEAFKEEIVKLEQQIAKQAERVAALEALASRWLEEQSPNWMKQCGRELAAVLMDLTGEKM